MHSIKKTNFKVENEKIIELETKIEKIIEEYE